MKKTLLLAVAAGIATEIFMAVLNLGTPFWNGGSATIAAFIVLSIKKEA